MASLHFGQQYAPPELRRPLGSFDDSKGEHARLHVDGRRGALRARVEEQSELVAQRLGPRRLVRLCDALGRAPRLPLLPLTIAQHLPLRASHASLASSPNNPKPGPPPGPKNPASTKAGPAPYSTEQTPMSSRPRPRKSRSVAVTAVGS